jgi:hypothetical protein
LWWSVLLLEQNEVHDKNQNAGKPLSMK